MALVAGFGAVRWFVLEPFAIPSASMSPTLRAGDQVVVDKLAYGGAAPLRSDLVVFRAPPSGEILLKRVVALGGDTVAIEDGALFVNGVRRRERYADPKAIDSVYFGPVTVPRGTIFVLGDNRADSLDSRQFGAVSREAVIGRVAVRIWPPERWGGLG